MEQPDQHERFEKPGAHLFWVQSGEGELEYRSRRFRLHRGGEVWLVDMNSPRIYIPSPGRHLAIAGFRFGGPGLEFWHETIRDRENAEFALDDLRFATRTQNELLRLVRRQPVGWEWQVHLAITHLLGKLLMSRELLISPQAELPPPVVRVLNAISTNPARDWKAKELATVAKISYSGLRASLPLVRPGNNPPAHPAGQAGSDAAAARGQTAFHQGRRRAAQFLQRILLQPFFPAPHWHDADRIPPAFERVNGNVDG